MNPSRLIKPDSVSCDAPARSKKHCLDILSELLADANPVVSTEEIFSKLVERERLGSTSLGNGVAFPHCRFSGITVSEGALLKLAEPVEFDSPDGEPVDLVVGMMVPEDIEPSHRTELLAVKNVLGDAALCERMRGAKSSKELYDAWLEATAGEQAPSRSAGDG